MDNGRVGNDMMSRWLFGSSDEIPRRAHVIERARGLESINDNLNCHVLNCLYASDARIESVGRVTGIC